MRCVIECINQVNFNDFGNILNEEFINKCHQLTIGSKQIESLFSHDQSCTKLDIIKGVAILCVSPDPLTMPVRFFLLDKAVSINPGIYYRVIPLYGECTIQIFEEKADRRKIEVNNVLTSFTIDPKVEIEKIYTLFYQERELGFLFKGESHNFWEFTYIDKGYIDTEVEGIKYRLNQGEAIFYGKGQHHNQYTDQNTAACFITITFDMQLQGENDIIHNKLTIDTEIQKLLKKIVDEKENNLYYSEDLILCYFKEMLIKLLRNLKFESTLHTLDSASKSYIENDIVARSIEYIQNNIDKKINLTEIAHYVSISQSYLSRIFKKQMGITPIEYISRLRLEKGKDLIRTGKYTFTQIADMLGFTSVHYFSRQFKEEYGISPSSYSKSIRR